MTFREIDTAARALGFWCVPIAGKRPLTSWKPFQSRAPKQAFTDCWSRRWPWAGGATPTGETTDLLVLDLDSQGALDWFKERSAIDTWVLRTVRGWHLHYQWPRFEVRNSAGELAESVDVRGAGGLAISAGSTRWVLNGRRWEPFTYEWLPGHSPNDLPRAAVPQWLLDELRRKHESRQVSEPAPARPYLGHATAWARAALENEVLRLCNAANGTRNATLLSVANRLGSLVAAGALEARQVQNQVLAVTLTWEDEPKSKSRDTLARGFRHGLSTPAVVPTRKR